MAEPLEALAAVLASKSGCVGAVGSIVAAASATSAVQGGGVVGDARGITESVLPAPEELRMVATSASMEPVASLTRRR